MMLMRVSVCALGVVLFAACSGSNAEHADAQVEARDASVADSTTAADAFVVTDAATEAAHGDATLSVDASVDASNVADASVVGDASTPDLGADAGTLTVPVYYAHDDGVFGPLLYREFRRVPASLGEVQAAVEAMLHMPALDPDYASLWPVATTLLGVTITGTAATIDLSDDAMSPALGSAAEEIALQQLVYTVTAADNSITSVTLHIEGESVESLWGHIDTSGPMTRAPRLDVVGRIWIIDPQEGDVLSALTFQGDATVFEATVSWRVERACLVEGCSDTPFTMSGHTSASEGAPGRGAWAVTVSLPDSAFDGDGLVRISVWESSAKDGSPLHIDDKVVVVTH